MTATQTEDYMARTVPNRLSPSKARLLLPPHCPAKFRWALDNPEPDKAAFDLGNVTHKLVLGEGDDIFVLDPATHGLKADGHVADNPASTAMWKKTAAEARERGQIPISADDYIKASQMAYQVHQHPAAGAIFADGNPEFWLEADDPQTGVSLRGRADWMTMIGGSVAVVDYKTAQSAHAGVFARKAVDFGYHLQGAWYRKLLQLMEIEMYPDVLFVVQEKEPPYLCNVIRLDEEALALGEAQMRQAIDTFVWCRDADDWPAYGLDVQTVSLPGWAFKTATTTGD